MQSAAERYRTGKVIPPKGTGTSSSYQPSSAAGPGTTAGSINQPASVK
jgi:hypothetical protein